MRKIRIYMVILAVCCGGSHVLAQDVKLTASAPRVVQSGEQFRLTFTVNARPSSFDAPEMEPFYVISGPNQSTSQSFQIINGKSTSSVTISYTYYLQATGAGQFSIPPARVVVDKKEYSSNVVEIEVVDGGQAGSTPPAGPQGSGNAGPSSSPPEPGTAADELYVRLITDRQSIYLGEPLIVTIKLFTRLQLSGFGDSKMPDFAGFWTQEIEAPTQLNLVRENVNGRIYNTAVIRKLMLFPQKTGEISIDPFTLETYVRQQVRRSRSPFDDFFGSSYSNVLKPLATLPVKINVKPLPEEAPESFKGAVGKLDIRAEIDKTEAKTNDALTYRVRISGQGNIQLLEEPRVMFPPDFERYDPKINTRIDNTDNGQTGSKVFEYLLIPRHAGNFRIAPIRFSYFDPARGTYQTISTEAFNLTVEKGEEDVSVPVISGRTKEDLQIIGQDILFIKDDEFRLYPIGKGFFLSLAFYMVYGTSLAAFLLILYLRRKQIRRLADEAMVRNQRASKEARKRLKRAAEFLRKQEQEAFYEAVLKALEGYLVDKLGIPVARFSRETAREGLSEQGMPEALIMEYTALADQCEMARFAPSGKASETGEVYRRSIKLIADMDQNLRKGGG